MAGCTNAVPQVSSLTEAFWLSFDSPVKNYTSLAAVSISGSCGPASQGVEYSVDNGTTWQSLSQNSVSASDTCRNNKSFQVTLDLTTHPAATWVGSPAGDFHVLFRAKTLVGYTTASNLILRKNIPTKLSLASSSRKQAIGGYKVTTRLVNTASAQDNGSYKVKLKVSQ